jgi:hypothetical protein
MITITKQVFTGNGSAIADLCINKESGELKFRQYFELHGFEMIGFSSVHDPDFEAFLGDNELLTNYSEIFRLREGHFLEFFGKIDGDY